MIRHGIFKRDIFRRRAFNHRLAGGRQATRPQRVGPTQTIRALPITMIEASGQAALMPLPCGASLQGAGADATGRTAIALPAIAMSTEEKAGATRARLAETLPEGFDHQPCRRHRASPKK